MNMSDTQRVNGWLTAVEALHGHPWRWPFGWGPETFRAVYRLHRTQHAADLIGAHHVADHAHNLPLELLVSLGAVGAAACAYLAWEVWREADDEGRACMVAALTLSMVEPLFFPPAAMLFLLVGSSQRRAVLKFWTAPTWARVAALALTALSIGVWVDDLDPRRRLWLHPRESEANQQAIVEAIQRGDGELAVVYATRAAKADPMWRELQAQAEQLEAAVRARRAAPACSTSCDAR